MNDLDTLYGQWEEATARLPWGTQRAFRSVFEAVRDNGTTLIYGRDYLNNFPCLVNTVGVMLTTSGGVGVPSRNFADVVSLFDRINRVLEQSNVNDKPGYVSELAADIFLHHFAPLKDEPEPSENEEALQHVTQTDYVEPSDEDLAAALEEMFLTEPEPEPKFEIKGSSTGRFTSKNPSFSEIDRP